MAWLVTLYTQVVVSEILADSPGSAAEIAAMALQSSGKFVAIAPFIVTHLPGLSVDMKPEPGKGGDN